MSIYSFDLSDRVVLVTGASSGLGAHFARVLAASGARVVIGARRLARLEELRDEISAAGGDAYALEMDVTDEMSIRNAYDEAEEVFGPIDSVIANAGGNVAKPALDLDVAAFDAVFAVNVRGVFLTVREGARRMIAAGAAERRHGRIVIISSITATAVTPGLSPYSASKAAILQLGRVLAREWATKGINVNSICPGYIETDINGAWFRSEDGRQQIARWPRGRLMPTDAIDAQLLFLVSNASAFVTGASFLVDDGQTLGG